MEAYERKSSTGVPHQSVLCDQVKGLSRASEAARDAGDRIKIMADRLFGPALEPVRESSANSKPNGALDELCDLVTTLHERLNYIDCQITRLENL